MFKFLKDKLKGALEKISKKIEEAPAPEEKETTLEATKQKETKEIKAKKEKKTAAQPKELKKKKEKKETVKHDITEPSRPEENVEPVQAVEEKVEDIEEKRGFFFKLFKKKDEAPEERTELPPEQKKEQPEKKGILSRITQKIATTQISPIQFDELFSDLEIALLENNVALAVIDKIKDKLKKDLVNTPIARGKVFDTIKISLQQSIKDILSVEKVDIIQHIKSAAERPFVIVFVGVNGSGKTTTISKIAHLLKRQGLSCIMAAGDTWRAASIQQLEEHGKNLGVRVVKHDYGSDPAAVAFDGIKAAQAKNIDVVLIDTAGRQHSNKNLMEEMKKIIRVAKPHLKIFVGEALTGNDAVDQAREFNDAIGIDGIILTKSDVDEKGGAALSAGYVTGKPILYLGVGQQYDDLADFSPATFLKGVGL